MENQEAGTPESQALTSKITFRLPAELHRRFKIVQVHDGRSMEEVLEGMVEAWVRKKEGERDDG